MGLHPPSNRTSWRVTDLQRRPGYPTGPYNKIQVHVKTNRMIGIGIQRRIRGNVDEGAPCGIRVADGTRGTAAWEGIPVEERGASRKTP